MSIAEFANEFKFCMVCYRESRELLGLDCLDVHHIERRSGARSKLRDERINLMMACRGCHESLLATMPHKQQLAYKLIADPLCAESIRSMISAWLEIRIGTRPTPERVTVAEVMGELMTIRIEMEHIKKIDNFLHRWRLFIAIVSKKHHA